MKRVAGYTMLLVVAVLGGSFWASQKERLHLSRFSIGFGSPIRVTGFVRAETGQAIAGATVEYRLNDQLGLKPDPKGKTFTDANGAFVVEGVAHSIYLRGWQTGYYSLPDSDRVISAATSQTPVVLTLKTAGPHQRLMRNIVEGQDIPIDGTPVEIHLSRPSLAKLGVGHLRMQLWVETREGSSERHYPWRVRISVPGGGLTERPHDLDFIAPVDGYKDVIEFVMSFSPDGKNQWRSSFEKDFYLKLPDKTFARGRLRLTTAQNGGRVSCLSWWSTSGSNNLEVGPSEFEAQN